MPRREVALAKKAKGKSLNRKGETLRCAAEAEISIRATKGK